MKAKAKREEPLKINMGFDESIRLALNVKPPSEGWSAHHRSPKRPKRRRKTAAK
jgi:hypothetical protein